MRNGHSSGTGPRILLECDHPSAVPSLTRSRCGGTTRTGLPSANSHAVWLNSTSGWRRPPKPKAQGPVASGPPWRGRACQAVDRSASRGLIDQSEPFPFPAWSSLPVHSPAPPKMQRSSRRMALTGSNLCGAESPPAYSGSLWSKKAVHQKRPQNLDQQVLEQYRIKSNKSTLKVKLHASSLYSIGFLEF
jgi:hypothetical protein